MERRWEPFPTASFCGNSANTNEKRCEFGRLSECLVDFSWPGFTFTLFHAKMIQYLKRSAVDLNSKIQEPSVDFLFDSILTLKTREECYAFFEDLCTVPEIKAMSQRLLVAHMLSNKKVYSDIVSETGASTATISRVNRSLHYGCDGYELIFKRLEDGEKKE